MTEQVLTQTVLPDSKTTATPVQANEVKQDDIVSRASSFKAQPDKVDNLQEAKFDVNEIAKIQDPVARKLAEDAYKSFQADYTRKTQDLAKQRKELEVAQSLKSKSFTLTDVDELLSNPSFIQAAQEKQRFVQPQQTVQNGSGELTDEEFSYLSPEMQKVYIGQKQNKDMLAQLSGQLQSAQVEKEDMALKSRYSNYSSDLVNQTYRDMMTCKVNATREHLWKALDYDDGLKRAYALGRQDEKSGISQARQASTQVSGVTTQTLDADVPTKLVKESFQDYWKRVAQSAKTKLGQK